jgi:hypothetical protein
VETADIIRAIERIYEEMKEGRAVNAGLSLEILLDDLSGQNPKVSDLSFFRRVERLGLARCRRQFLPRLENCLENLHDHPARHVLRGVVGEIKGGGDE